MSFDIPIKFDPGEAVNKAKAFEDALGKTEDAGIAAGQAMGKLTGAFGKLREALEQEQRALQRTSQLHDELIRKNQPAAQGFAKVAEAIRREQEMLERIHGPAKRYAEDLQVLDSLLDRNKISTDEYARAVAGLNARMRETPSQPEQPNMRSGASAIGSTLGLAAGPALVGAAVGAAKQIQNLVHEGEELQDRYTKLANHSMKFTTATKGVNVVLDEQMRLARDLRTDLGSAMNIYDAVGDATDELGLSQRQLIGLTRTLGEGATLAGKSFDQAGNVIARFAIATTAGANGAGEMRKLLRDFPELGRALADAWQTDKAGVIDMVTSGKKNIQDLADVWIYQSGRIHEAAQARKRSHAEIRAAVMEEAEVALNRGVPASVAYNDAALKIHETYRKAREGGRSVSDVMLEVSSTIADQAAEWQRLEDRVNGARAAMGINGMQGAISDLLGGMRQLAQVADQLGEKFADSAFGRATGNQVERAKQMRDARVELEALRLELKDGSLTAHEYEQRYEALIAKLNGGQLPATIKLWHQINDGARQYKRELEALIALNSAGRLTDAEFRRGLAGVVSRNPDGDIAARIKAEGEARERLLDVKKREKALFDDPAGLSQQAEREKQVLEVLRSIEKPSEKYAAELRKISELQAVGAITAEQYAAAQRQLAKQFGMEVNYLTDAWHREIEANKQATEQARELGEAFRPLKETIVDMFRDGELSADRFLDTLSDIALKMLEVAAIKSIQGNVGGQTGGFLAGLLGGANGFDYLANNKHLQLPGFARGGDALVTGAGGTDSKIAAFRITPGESIHVRTPQQRADAAASSAGGGPVQVMVVAQNNERDVIEAGDSYGAQRVFVHNQRRYGRRTR